jgi:hypothetical protein
MNPNIPIPATDPNKGNWFVNPLPTDPCWYGLDLAFWKALPPSWQVLQQIADGLARVAAYNALAAAGPAILTNGRRIADPRIMAYGLSPYSTTRNSMMYLAIEPEVVFPNGYPPLWNSSTDVQDFPAWAPPVMPPSTVSPIGMFEEISTVNGLPKFSPATGDASPPGKMYTDPATGSQYIKMQEGSASMIGGQVPVFWFQTK